MVVSPHVTLLGWETDQYELRTRVKVRGPLTTLKTAWSELWRTSKIKAPVGLWHDPADAANLRVLSRSTKRLYKLRQSDRVILSSVYLGAKVPHPLGLSGDPGDATVYWVLEAPWRTTGSTSGNKVMKFRKADNVRLASYAIPDGRWSAIKVSAAYMWLTNLDTDKVYKRSKADASAIASYTIKYDSSLGFPQTNVGTAQTNPSGMMIDGTTLHYFFANAGGTARFLTASESAPRTLTGKVATAGTKLHGGEMDTVTHTECYGDSDDLDLTAKFTLREPVTNDVAQEAVDADLEDELGALAQVEPRIHDAHPADGAHAFLVRRETISIDEVESMAQAMEVAQTQLLALSARRQILDVGIIGNPALQKTDLVSVADPLVGITVDGRIDTLETDMDAGGAFLGVLALVPQSVLITDDITDEGVVDDDGGFVEEPTPDPSDPGEDDATGSASIEGIVGFGSGTSGGDGGTEYHVTETSGTGPGSLPDAVSGSNRRIVFDVDTVALGANCYVTGDHITLDGSTAPSGAVNVTGHPFYMDGGGSHGDPHDIIAYNIRFRGGWDGTGGSIQDADAVTIARGAHDIVLKNCSLAGYYDEAFDCWNGAYNVTLQDCLIGPGEGDHNFAILLGGDGGGTTRKITLYRNLITGTSYRNPAVGNNDSTNAAASTITADVVNNLIVLADADYAMTCYHGGAGNFVNNWVRMDNHPSDAGRQMNVETNGQAYVAGNYSDGSADIDGESNHAAWPVDTFAQITPDSAPDAAAYVLDHAGAFPRDAFDLALIPSL